jgi:glutamate synthase domain-containing protein 1
VTTKAEHIGRDEKEVSGCAISGIMSEAGDSFSGEDIIRSIASMRERSSGLGGGFAAYGIYPAYADEYAFHVMYDNDRGRQETKKYLKEFCEVVHREAIPIRPMDEIRARPMLYRYFLHLKEHVYEQFYDETEEDIIVRLVMHINLKVDGAYVMSSGKNMGVFKGVGYPEEIGCFFKLDEYEGWTWLAHGRFPTNTTGWWGGAHPFGLLDWAVVHNGEISSYGINRRYLENFGYSCTLHTDTEVITYLVDLLMRKHELPLEMMSKVLAPPFWSQIERMSPDEAKVARTLRMVYGGALLNGPFSIVVGHAGGMFGLNDRTKLRPMAAARKDDRLYISSEEVGIRTVCEDPDEVWHAEGGVPVAGRLKKTQARGADAGEKAVA